MDEQVDILVPSVVCVRGGPDLPALREAPYAQRT